MDNWNFLYKKNYEDGHNETTNMLYTPFTNDNKTVLCMSWDETSKYQQDQGRAPLTADLINFFFQRELRHLMLLQGNCWAPKILELDLENRKIFIEWNNESLNHILLSGRKLDDVCPDWREQIFKMLGDLKAEGFYKMALYPHCFFIGNDNKIKTIDFYSCVGIEERYIPLSKLQGMIGNQSTDRFVQSTVGDNVDFKKFIKITMEDALSKTWKDNPFPEFYKILFKEQE